ncbi:HpcH/HpaI aldolase/citrate lyase family protein [Paraburkholderia dipogonis]|nr:aldolase/citrate lyase family protein [Paraburkholderia dipogonis]
MKVSELSTNPLRRKFASGKTAYGLWVTLESPAVTEIAAAMGVDWICIDLEHGALDFSDVLNHLRAAKGTDMAVIARVPASRVDTIKKCLDIGVDGVVLPLINSADELREAFEHARYPTVGKRGLGGERAVRWGLGIAEYIRRANEDALVIPVIETRSASENIEAILDVPGLETIFFGPADLSSSMGYIGEWEGPGVAEDILRIQRSAAKRGIVSGVIGMTPEDMNARETQGFQMIGLGSDGGMLIKQFKQLFGKLKGETYEHNWF